MSNATRIGTNKSSNDSPVKANESGRSRCITSSLTTTTGNCLNQLSAGTRRPTSPSAQQIAAVITHWNHVTNNGASNVVFLSIRLLLMNTIEMLIAKYESTTRTIVWRDALGAVFAIFEVSLINLL